MGKTICTWVLAATAISFNLRAQSVLYETRFERSEGYNIELDLAGQNGWLADGNGGNGLLTNFFAGLGQQAYIGFAPPDTGIVTTVWRPLPVAPPANAILRFSVKMEIVESTVGNDDDFRWAAYNTNGDRLFGVSFETETGQIWYQNEDLVFQNTGITFDTRANYDFEIWIDPTRNSWTARLNEVVLANAQPISTTNSSRTIGDVDAVWFINDTASVGNNYMVFDNYKITTENVSSIPVFLDAIGRSTNGFFTFLVHGQVGERYSVDYTTNFSQWFSLGEYVNTAGTFLFEDDRSAADRYRFYRVRKI